MAGGVERSDANASVSGGELDRLMQTEERLHAVLAESEAEVARIRDGCRRSVDAAHDDFERQLTQAQASVRARVNEERDGEIARISQEHEAQRASLEAISDGQVEELASLIIQRLLGIPPASSSSSSGKAS